MSRVTRHLWAVISLDGRVLEQTPSSLAVFLTKATAATWMYNNCSARQQIKRVPIPEWWQKPNRRES